MFLDPKSPRIRAAAAVVTAAALGAWLWSNEGQGANLAFAYAVTGALAALLVAISRRPLFSILATCGFVAFVVGVARAKRAVEGMVFHAWDIAQAFWSWREAEAAMRAHAPVWAAFALAVLVGAAALAALWRREPPVRGRVAAAGLFALCAASVAWIAPRLSERGHTQFFWDGLYLTAFYRSFGETSEAVARGGLFETPAAGPGAPIAAAGACAPTGKPPHVLLIHEESVVQPSVFPGLWSDPALEPFFRSFDGRTHRMRVETYGGASWLTQFSVLTGVSARAFGSMSNYVQPFMSGRVREAVPQILAACGYRTMMFTAWPKLFMGVARFYESIGVAEIFDQKAQGNKRENERDRFFFANALDQIEKSLNASPAPVFQFIETMSAHWPYDVVYEPNVDVPGGAPGVHPEVHEYLRRLAMVKMDDDWLRAELRRRFPGEAFLIVRYGDHHPLATRSLIGLPEEAEAQDVHLPDDSIGLITFWAVDGVGYAPPPLPPHETVDAAYLGAILLASARLPLPPSWRERLDLMRDCDGRYWTCPDHARVLDFQRRLSAAGLVRAR